jgi:hypothetical protein
MAPSAGIVLFAVVVAFLAQWVWQLQYAAQFTGQLEIDPLPLWIVLFIVVLSVMSFLRWAHRGFAPRATQVIRRQPVKYNSDVQKIAERYARSFAWRRGLELK